MPSISEPNNGISAIAVCATGWAGTVKTTISGTDAEVTPDDYTSALRVWMDLLRISMQIHGEDWEGYSTAGGVLSIVADSAHTLVATSTTQTRLGATGTYTGAASYEMDAAHDNGVYPTHGIAVPRNVGWELSRGRHAVDGSGTVGRVRVGAGMSVRLCDSWSAIHTFESALDAEQNRARLLDIWVGGHDLGRYQLQGMHRERVGLVVDPCALVLDLLRVAA